MSLPRGGTFAECESVTYPVTATGADWVMLHVPHGTENLPRHLESGARADGDLWARVPKDALERYFSVRVTVAWQGEELELGRIEGDTAEVLGDSPVVADRLGLEGDQYNGFRATVPVEELTVVDVAEKEIDV